MIRKKNIIRLVLLLAFSSIIFSINSVYNKSNTTLNKLYLTGAQQTFQLPACSAHSRDSMDKCSLNKWNRKCFKLFWNTDDFKYYVKNITNIPSTAADGEEKFTMQDCKQFAYLEHSVGRLGNQMFQIAGLLGIAYENDLIPVIRPNARISKYFDLPNRIKFIPENLTRCEPAFPGIYEECPKTRGNMTIKGFFQSWKYFKNIPDIIRKTFAFKMKYRVLAKSFIAKHSKLNHKNVCLHIRRGDMMWTYHRNRGLQIAGIDYIYRAMNFFKTKNIKIVFFVASDDIEWCKANINQSVIFSPFTDPGHDLALLSFCDNVIVTSGTFGWWGAWLSGGETVYFSGYPRPGSSQDKRMNRMDYYPSDWIGFLN